MKIKRLLLVGILIGCSTIPKNNHNYNTPNLEKINYPSSEDYIKFGKYKFPNNIDAMGALFVLSKPDISLKTKLNIEEDGSFRCRAIIPDSKIIDYTSSIDNKLLINLDINNDKIITIKEVMRPYYKKCFEMNDIINQ